MTEPAPHDGNGNGITASWGDKGVTARGPLAVAALIVIVFGAGLGYIMWHSAERIAVAQTASAAAIAQSQRDSTTALIKALESSEARTREQHEVIAQHQRLTNCLNSYDFASRQRLRKRAEDGEVNLDAWCRWMDALRGQIGTSSP